MTGQYPLTWPAGWPRTEHPEYAGAKFGSNLTIERARTGLYRELGLMGASDVQLSSNLELRLDGMPRSGQRRISDAGVTVYFERGGEDLVLACDLYENVEDNIRALALVVESMRRVERYGGDRMMERVFTGFARIEGPKADREEPWWEVLGLTRDTAIIVVEATYRSLAKKLHPDGGGSETAMARLNKAIQEARKR